MCHCVKINPNSWTQFCLSVALRLCSCCNLYSHCSNQVPNHQCDTIINRTLYSTPAGSLTIIVYTCSMSTTPTQVYLNVGASMFFPTCTNSVTNCTCAVLDDADFSPLRQGKCISFECKRCVFWWWISKKKKEKITSFVKLRGHKLI